jgi:hypothetical protein
VTDETRDRISDHWETRFNVSKDSYSATNTVRHLFVDDVSQTCTQTDEEIGEKLSLGNTINDDNLNSRLRRLVHPSVTRRVS